MSRRIRRTIAIAVMLAVGAAACGDDSGTSAPNTTSAPTATAAPSATAAATETCNIPGGEIVVGGLYTKSIFPGTEDATQARFDRANREGGVNGCKIRYVGLKDDGADAANALTLTRQLIDKDKVMAIVPVISTGFLPQSSDVAIAAKVPFIGWGFLPGFCGNDYGFGFSGCVAGTSVSTSLLLAIAKAINKDPKTIRYAVLGKEDTTGRNGVKYQKQIADYLGIKMAYAEAIFPATQTSVDYTPFVQALIASKPDVITLYNDFQNDVGMVAALHAAGFKGVIVSPTTYIPGILEAQPAVAAAIEDSWITSPIPAGEGNSEQVKQIAADLKASGKSPFLTLGAQVAWVNADLFVQMMVASKAKTGEELATAVNKGFTYKPAGGGVGPVKFPEGHKLSVPCAAVIHIINKKYEEALPMTCFELLPGT